MNPRVGSGVQQTRRISDGANRPGGEKPRRRNVTSLLARAGRNAPSEPGNRRRSERGSGHRGLMSMEGRSLETPREEPDGDQAERVGRRLQAPDRRANGHFESARIKSGSTSGESVRIPNKSELSREKPTSRNRRYHDVKRRRPFPVEGVEGTGPARDPH